MKKRILSFVLTIVMMLSFMPVLESTADASEDWRAWEQSDSRWGSIKLGKSSKTVSSSGCLVTSVAKIMIQGGFVDPSSFNVGTLAKWLNNNNGYDGANLYFAKPTQMVSGFSFTGYNYGSSNGITGKSSACESKLMELVKKEYHIIIAVNNYGHYIAVDNAKSLETGKIYIMDTLKGVQNADLLLTDRYDRISDVFLYSGWAKPLKNYIDDECMKSLPTYGVISVKEETDYYTLPCNWTTANKLGYESNKEGTLKKGTIATTGLYQNSEGNWWYAVTYKDKNNKDATYYIPATNTEWQGYLAPYHTGDEFATTVSGSSPLKGTINSGGSKMTKLYGQVYKGNTTSDSSKLTSITTTVSVSDPGKSYSLRGNALDTAMDFSKLSQSAYGKGQYTLAIKADFTYNYVKVKTNWLGKTSYTKVEDTVKNAVVYKQNFTYTGGTTATPTTYTVTFNAGGGTCSTTNLKYTKNDTLGDLPTPTLDGYTFKGWYTKPYSGTKVTTSTKVTANTTYYAHWERSTNLTKVQFDVNGGNSLAATKTGQATSVNTERGAAALVVYNNTSLKATTDKNGYEVAVDANGKVTATRSSGSTTQLSIPSGGFVISEGTSGSGFVKYIISMSEAWVSVDYATGKVYAYDSYADYLACTMYRGDYTRYEDLPLPTRSGYVFAGWKDANGIIATYNTGFGYTKLTAQWTTAADAWPVAYDTYNGHYYELFDCNMSWTQAKSFCEARGGHLAVITTSAEQTFVKSLVQEGSYGLYYIGATDASGSWKWVTGEAFSYESWDDDLPEPSNGVNEYYSAIMAENYGANKHIGDWVDSDNIIYSGFYNVTNTGFVCEYEKESICEHEYTYVKKTTPTLTATGSLSGTCKLCGSKTTVTLPKLNKTNYVYSVATAATCTAKGSDLYEYKIDGSTFQYTVSTAKKNHTYKSVTTAPTCEDYGYITYTCTACGDSYKEYQTNEWTEWSEAYPAGVDKNLIETVTQYRYADYETKTSDATSLSGYEQIGSSWVKADTGTIKYVSSWPSGFSKSHSLYTTYNKTPVKASETATTKVEVSSSVCGYIYYHWCRGTYTSGPINRSTSQTKTSTFNSFHAFYSTSSAPQYDPSGANGQSSRYYKNASCCKDSYWYYPITVYSQTYNEYEKQYTYGKWGSWSDWSETKVTASSTRKVETRTMYRYAVSPIGEHTWDDGSVTTAATCTTDGVMTYTCSVCDSVKTEQIPAIAHTFTAEVTAPTCDQQGYTVHSCENCDYSYTDEYTEAVGHTWSAGEVTVPSQPGVKGEMTYTCQLCDEVKTEDIEALPITYTISYDANGGSGAPNVQIKAEATDLVLSSIQPSKTGYTFLGWSTSKDSTTAEYAPGDTYTRESHAVLYAVWSANTYTITFDANNGTNAPAAQIKNHGVDLTIPMDEPTRVGHTFVGWANTSDATLAAYAPGAVYATNGDATLYAVWEKNTYTVTLNANGGTMTPGSVTVTYNETYGTLPIPTKTGCIFSGWYTAKTNGDLITSDDRVTITENQTLYAHWEWITYSVTYNGNGADIDIDTQSKVYNTNLTLDSTKPTRTGYTFVGWATDSEATTAEYQPKAVYTENKPLLLYAIWSVNTYTVTFDPGDGVVDLAKKTVTFGETYGNLPVPELENHTFAGWFTSASSGTVVSEDLPVNMASDHTIYAHWDKVEVISGTCGENVSWELDFRTQTLRIFGSGAIKDYSYGSSTPFYKYRGDITKIVVEDGVTEIGNYSFYYLSAVTSVSLPDGVTRIGDNAFYRCEGLSSIVFPDTVASIGELAFCRCIALKEVVLPAALSTLEGRVFKTCTGIEEISLPAELKVINTDVFLECTALTTINVEDENTYFCLDSQGALYNKEMTVLVLCPRTYEGTFVVPDGVTTVGERAFYYCSKVSRVELPIGLTAIESYAFDSCSALKDLVLPETLTSLGSYCFSDCDALKTIVIPEGVTVIPIGAFNGCAYLKSVDLPKTLTEIKSYAFQNCHRLSGTIIIPEGVTKIPDNAFFSCKMLTRVVFPSTLQEIGGSAFRYCWNLKIELPDGLTTIGAQAFDNCCYGTKELIIPDSVTSIGQYAFRANEYLETVILSESLTEIPDSIFTGCNKLKSATVGAKVTKIGSYAFNGASYADTYFAGTEEEWSAINFGNYNTVLLASSIHYNNEGRTITYFFDANGGDIGTTSKTELFGNPYGELPVPTRENYVFSGWYTEKEGGTLITAETVIDTGTRHTLYAHWIPVEYTVAYDANNGENAPEPQVKQYGVDLMLTTKVPTRDGYTFLGWTSDTDAINAARGLTAEYKPGDVYDANNALTLYAIWDANTCSVSFDANGGSAVDPVSVVYADTYGVLPTSVREGYSFAGWRMADGTVVTEDTIVHELGSHVLTAIWEPDTYTISFDANGGGAAPDAQRKIHDISLVLSDVTPIRNGYDFVGWATSANATEAEYQKGAFYTNNKEITLYAIWTPLEFVVSFDANGGTLNEKSITVTYLNAYGVLPVPEKDDYIFGGWATAEDGIIDSETVVQIVGDHTLIARWNPSSYSVSYNANGGTNAPVSQIKYHNQDLVVTGDIPERAGYTFLGWALSEDTATVTYASGDVIKTNEELTLYAVWSANSYTLTLDALGGTVTPATKTVTYAESYGTLAEPVRDHYTFDGWLTAETDGMSVTADTIVSIPENHSIYAKWIGDPVVVSFDANGGFADITSKNAEYGQSFGELPNAERSGYVFAGWYTKAEAGELVTAETEVASPEETTLYAHWTLETYTVSYDANGGTAQIASQTKEYGKELTLSSEIPERNGYVFLGWASSSEAETAEYSSEDIYYQDNDIVLYAVWTEFVEQPIVITTASTNTYGLPGQEVFISVDADGDELAYCWQFSADHGTTWTDCAEDSAETATLRIVMEESLAGYLYRCVVTDASGNSITTEAIILDLKPCEAVITAQPADYFGIVGDTAIFTVEAEGTNLSYQWYYTKDQGETWRKTTLVGSSTKELKVRLTENNSGRMYKCDITDQYDQTMSTDAALLAMATNDIAIVEQPESCSGQVNEIVRLHVEAIGDNLSYQWYVSEDYGTTWERSTLAGYNTDTLNVRLYEHRDGYTYRCLIISGGTVATITDTATVYLVDAGIEILQQPEDYVGQVNDLATFTVQTNRTDLEYAWYYSTDNGQSWTSCATDGYNTASLNVRVYEYRDGYLYKCVLMSSDGHTLESTVVRIQIESEVVIDATQMTLDAINLDTEVDGEDSNCTKADSEDSDYTETDSEDSDHTEADTNNVEEEIVSNVEISRNGSLSDDKIQWSFDEDGVLKLIGTGEMEDFSEETPAPWCVFNEEIVSIEIEEGITSIGKRAFAECSKLEEVLIPESVATIAEEAFNGCEKLKEIAIPSTTTYEENSFDENLEIVVVIAAVNELLEALDEYYGTDTLDNSAELTDSTEEVKEEIETENSNSDAEFDADLDDNVLSTVTSNNLDDAYAENAVYVEMN